MEKRKSVENKRKSAFLRIEKQKRQIDHYKKKIEYLRTKSENKDLHEKIIVTLEKYPTYIERINNKIARREAKIQGAKDNIEEQKYQQELQELNQAKEDLNQQFMLYAKNLLKIENEHTELFSPEKNGINEKIVFINDTEKRALDHLEVSEKEMISDWERESLNEACESVRQKLPEPNIQESSEYLNSLANTLERKKYSLETIDEKYRQAKHLEKILDVNQDKVQPILKQIHNDYNEFIAICSQLGITYPSEENTIEQGHPVLVEDEDGRIVLPRMNNERPLENLIQHLRPWYVDACQEAHFTLFRDKASEKQGGLNRRSESKGKFSEALKQLKEIQTLTSAFKELLTSTNEGDPVKRLIWETARSIVATTVQRTTASEEMKEYNQTIQKKKEKLQKISKNVNKLKGEIKEISVKGKNIIKSINEFNKKFDHKIEITTGQDQEKSDASRQFQVEPSPSSETVGWWVKASLKGDTVDSTQYNRYLADCEAFSETLAEVQEKLQPIKEKYNTLKIEFSELGLNADKLQEIYDDAKENINRVFSTLYNFSKEKIKLQDFEETHKRFEKLQGMTNQFKEMKQVYEWLLNYPEKNSKSLDSYRDKILVQNIEWLGETFVNTQEAIENANEIDQIKRAEIGMKMASDQLKDRKNHLQPKEADENS